MQPNEYDIIIVGGRVTGAVLAAYLGQNGMKVLLLEKDALPSPHPFSCPMIQAATMAMLDEIGAPESEYARHTPPIHKMIIDDERMEIPIELPYHKGRNYGYAIDRARFDKALWDHALRLETVSGIQRFKVNHLLWDEQGESVIGVTGTHLDRGETARYYGKRVVGADGRFSIVARKTSAKTYDERPNYPTTVYYSYWEGVARHAQGEAISIAYTSASGEFAYLVMDSADNTTAIVVEGRSDIVAPSAGMVDEFYNDIITLHPAIKQRVRNARRVQPVQGIKRIGNLYRQAGGKGWVLVGDAYHQKDPIDGQGIYDAVYSAKMLAQGLCQWYHHQLDWDEMLHQYDEQVRAHTYPQYEATLQRIQGTLYGTLNPALPKSLLRGTFRWIAKDRVYQEITGQILNRQTDPQTTLKPSFLMMAALRGSLRELSERLEP